MTTRAGPTHPIRIHRAKSFDEDEWLRLRTLLWPSCPPSQHRTEMTEYLEGIGKAVFVAAARSRKLSGFLEATIRPFAEGCETEPVGYIEGWYVDADVRRRGIGKRLVLAAEGWARKKACVEMGSDCLLENRVSLRAHRAIGYEETERLIHFRKRLTPRP